MTPHQYCQNVAAASGSSFYYSFLFLPQSKRRAITALYAFCREIDDVVDESSSTELAQTKLNWWREEIHRLEQGTPQHPITQALGEYVALFNLPVNRLYEIIDGMAMDLTATRYQHFEDLQKYCYHVASVVGILSVHIFGYQDVRTLEYAHDLGIAFQLTNIIRDVGEDARRGRIYLPIEDLQRFNVTSHDILQGHTSPEFVALMAFQTERAQHFYTQAQAKLAPSDRKNQRSGLIMSAIYQTLLAEIAHDGYRVLSHRTSLTPVRKLWIAWKTWLSAS